MRGLKYSEIIRRNREFKNQMGEDRYAIMVFSNIITYQFNDIFEYHLRSMGINAQVVSGEYDNILQDSQKKSESSLVIIFYELANIIDGFHYKVNVLDDERINEFVSKVKGEITFIAQQLKDTSLVLFNKFSTVAFNQFNIKHNKFDYVCTQLNEHLNLTAPKNFRIIDIDKVLAQLSVEKSVDWRFFYSSKALYSIEFYKVYAEYISPVVLSAMGRAKKAIIFDCDNTLWKGILGEDGFDGIEMSGKTKDGAVFEEVQHIALELSKRGIIIGLCSKNNPEDVDEVIRRHPDMTLRDHDFVIKIVNWADKLTNLSAISEKLNIGLDSMVFVDDSDFEVNMVKEKLPQVYTLEVPKNLFEYPCLIRRHLGLFFSLPETEEDSRKTEMYKQNFKRESEKTQFNDFESYLHSLGLAITLYIDEKFLIPRLAQMTQKTNQFNLTTKRYTEGDIESFMDSDFHRTYAINVTDKFGDYGVTGLALIKIDEAHCSAEIDSLLMSCRILGRNIEYKFFDLIIEDLAQRNITALYAHYIRTPKNDQVSNLYDRYGFTVLHAGEKMQKYKLDLSQYSAKNIPYIEVRYGRQN